AVGPVLVLLVCARDNGTPHGGTMLVTTYATALVALSLAALGALLIQRVREGRVAEEAPERPRRAGAALVVTTVVLVFLAPAQGLGTGNALFFMAVNGFALWMVPIARAAVGAATRPTSYAAFALTASVVAAGV